MRSYKEIEKTVMTEETPPESYNNIEMHLFFVLQDVLSRFKANKINKDQAARLKKQAIVNYEKCTMTYAVYEHCIKQIAETEQLRIELRKNPNWKTAMKLIELYSGEVGMWNLEITKETV